MATLYSSFTKNLNAGCSVALEWVMVIFGGRIEANGEWGKNGAKNCRKIAHYHQVY